MLSLINASVKPLLVKSSLAASADFQSARAGLGVGRGQVKSPEIQQYEPNGHGGASAANGAGRRAALLRGRESAARDALASQRRDCCPGRRLSG